MFCLTAGECRSPLFNHSVFFLLLPPLLSLFCRHLFVLVSLRLPAEDLAVAATADESIKRLLPHKNPPTYKTAVLIAPWSDSSTHWSMSGIWSHEKPFVLLMEWSLIHLQGFFFSLWVSFDLTKVSPSNHFILSFLAPTLMFYLCELLHRDEDHKKWRSSASLQEAPSSCKEQCVVAPTIDSLICDVSNLGEFS